MADTYHDILRLRAIRQYTDTPLTDEHVLRLLEAARWTGSSKNNQAWGFVLVRDPETKTALAAAGRYTDPIRNAPATLALLKQQGGNDFDIGRMAQNVMLAASALGIASCPITLHDTSTAAAVLGLTSGTTCRYAIALGYPAPEAAPAQWGGRRALEDLVHFDAV